MKTNPFTIMLENLEKVNQKSETANSTYVPRDKTLNKLVEDNSQLIKFINTVNPFQPEMEHSRYFRIRDLEKTIRKLFPLESTIIGKLGTEGKKAVLKKWKEGIIFNLLKYRDDILPDKHKHITGNELIHIYTLPMVVLTMRVLFKVDRWNSINSFITKVCLNAATITYDINMDAKRYLDAYFKDEVKNKEISLSSISEYKSLKYKPLDESLNETLANNSHQDFLFAMENVSSYLKFIDIPKERLFSESLPIFNSIFKEIESIEQQINDLKLSKTTLEYKNSNSRDKEKVRSDIFRSELSLKDLKESTHLALKELSSAFDKAEFNEVIMES